MAKAQLDEDMCVDAIASYIKAEDPSYYSEVIFQHPVLKQALFVSALVSWVITSVVSPFERWQHVIKIVLESISIAPCTSCGVLTKALRCPFILHVHFPHAGRRAVEFFFALTVQR